MQALPVAWRLLVTLVGILPVLACATPSPDAPGQAEQVANPDELLQLYEAGRYEAARELAEQRAETGDPQAEYYLALYYSSYETHYDFARAFQWYSRAAEHGHPQSVYMLGLLYTTGYFVELYELAWRHHVGFELAQDLRTATALYQAAEKAGDPRASQSLRELNERGMYSLPPRRILHMLVDARAGNLVAQWGASVVFGKGMYGVQFDSMQSRLWLQRAADGGLPKAAEFLKKMIEHELAVSRARP
jgi:TPR repeat protein